MLGKRKRGGSAAAGHGFRKVKPVEEVTFDTSKREEYLSGFHKRKLQRIKYAREEAAKQEREDKIQQRKELREERKREVEEHVKAVSEALKKAEGGEDEDEDEDEEEDEEEWSGIKDAGSSHVDREDRYEDSDEEEEATVTVEAVDITRDGFQPVKDDDEDSDKEGDGDGAGEGEKEKKAKRVWTREKPKVPKKKRKKFRYESLAERQKNRAVIKAVKAKQRARREDK